MTAMAIPIAIHLWNRKSGRIIKVGSVKFLQESESSSYSSLRLTEVVLLLLRILLIILLSVIMAGAIFLSPNSTSNNKTILVDQELLNEPLYQQVFDSLEQFELHDLDMYSNTSNLDYWQIIKNLSDRPGEEFIVYSSNPLKKFKGKKSAMPSNVEWIHLPLSTKTFLVGALLSNRDSITVVLGNSDDKRLIIDKFKLKYSLLKPQFEVGEMEMFFDKTANKIVFKNDSISILPKPIFKCQVVYEEGFKEDLKYIDAAFKAINAYDVCTVDVEYVQLTEYNEGNPDWCFWLSEEKPKGDGKVILFDTESSTTSLLQNQYTFKYRLNPRYSSIVQIEKFPAAIIDLFLKDQFKNQLVKHDRRSVDNRQLFSEQTKDEIVKAKNRVDLATILWPLFFMVLAVERILSTIRKQ